MTVAGQGAVRATPESIRTLWNRDLSLWNSSERNNSNRRASSKRDGGCVCHAGRRGG